MGKILKMAHPNSRGIKYDKIDPFFPPAERTTFLAGTLSPYNSLTPYMPEPDNGFSLIPILQIE